MAVPETWDAWRFEQPAVTVVLRPVLGSDDEWRKHVASDERDHRTVFVTEDGEPRVRVHDAEPPWSEALPSHDDLAAACTVLVERGVATPGAKVNGLGISSELHLPEPLDSPCKPTKFYSPAGLEQLLETENRGYIKDLVEQLRSPMGVIPFVGAGMSAEFGFKLWDTFLRDCAARLGLENEVEELLRNGDHEGAAELLEERHAARFADLIKHTFRDPVAPSRLRAGAIAYLPLLTRGPIITTNFDDVLESVFTDAGRQLDVIEGPRAERTVAAVHRNQSALLKIHGSYDDRTFRVFTKKEFDRAYAEGTVTLTSLAWLTFTNRPLLFLGCSLEADRAMQPLARIQQELSQLGGLTHYAVLAAHYSVSRHLARQQELSRWGIRPIWYPPRQFPRIAEILRDLVEHAGTTKLSDPTGRARHRVPPSDESRLRSVDLPAVDPHPETRPVVDALLRGEVTFFLGAYAHLGRLPLGDAFYGKLADEFKPPSLAGGRSAVATFAASRKGPRILWKEARKLVAPSEVEPSSVYQVVTAMPSFLRSRGQKSPLWIFTTNYDTVLEQAFDGAGEPFHLLYYTEETGLFAHTSPDGSVREIERPDAIRDLRPPGTVVVKLNGGIVDGAQPTESAMIASAQFERLADRIPHALPACARTALRERSLLFLGHGLNEPDVQRLIAVFAAGHERGPWAVQLPPESSESRKTWEERRDYLNGLGLTTIVCDLQDFVADLHAALLAA